jgi:hypothetical protein
MVLLPVIGGGAWGAIGEQEETPKGPFGSGARDEAAPMNFRYVGERRIPVPKLIPYAVPAEGCRQEGFAE